MTPCRLRQMTEMIMKIKRPIEVIKGCLEEFINTNDYRERRKPGKRIKSLEENLKQNQKEDIIILSPKAYKYS